MNAKWEREVSSSSAKSGRLNEVLYPSEFVADGIYVTKRGHVAGVLRIEPVPFEIMDPEDLRRVTDQIEAARMGLDPAIRDYQYIVKTKLPSGLYQIRIYWALVYEQSSVHDWWSWFYFPKAGAAKIDSEVMSSAGILAMSLDALVRAVPGAERLGCEEVFQFLRRLLNYGPDRGLKLAYPWDLDHQISCERVDARSELIVGRHHLRVLTLEVTPKSAPVNMWVKFLDIPCEFIVVQEWKAVSPARTAALIKSMKTHFVNKLQGWRGVVGDITKADKKDQPLHPSQMMVDGSVVSVLKELEAAETATTEQGLYFGEWTLTCVLHSEDTKDLRAGVAGFLNTIYPHSAQASEGLGDAASAAWLSIIPGHERLNVRRLVIDNKALARMSFVFGPPEGNAYNEFLQAPYLSEWKTERGTPYFLNLHKGQVAHTVITGATGFGKTYTVSELITDTQALHPQTIVFDVTHSYRKLTADHGGSYLELGQSQQRQSTINSFALAPTKDNFTFNASFVRYLIESDGGPALDAEETQDLYEQVVSLMTTELPVGTRRLRNLHPQPKLARRLARWIGDGQYGWLFDNAEDTLSFATFQTFSFLGMQQDKEVLGALLFYVLHRSLQIINETDRPTFVWMDEALNFLENATMCNYIFKAWMNWRKLKAALILVVHSLSDIPHDTAVRMLQSCMTRIHLGNPGIDKEEWRNLLHCSQAQVDIIPKLARARQVLVEGAGIMNIVPSPERYAKLAVPLEKETACG